MREERTDRRRPKAKRGDRGTRHQARTQLAQLRGVKVKDVIGQPQGQPKPTEPTNPIKPIDTGDETMFKVVPAPDDPTMFVVQSEPMSREEADKKASVINALEEEEKGEGEKGMPPFGEKPASGPPPFAKRPPMPTGPGGMPPMPMMGM